MTRTRSLIASVMILAFSNACLSDEVLEGYLGQVRALQFSPDASVIATASWERQSMVDSLTVLKLQSVEVVLWSMRNRTAISKRQIPSTVVVDFAFAADLKTVALLERTEKMHEGRLKLLDAKTGKLLHQADTHYHHGYLKFSPDGRQLCQDNQLWDTSTLQVVTKFESHLHIPSSIDFLSSGKQVVISSLNDVIRCGPGLDKGPTDAVRFFDRLTGKVVGSIAGTGGANMGVHHVRYFPNGNLVAADQYKSVKVFDVHTGKTVGRFQPIEKRQERLRDLSGVSAIDVAVDESMLAVAFTDNVTAELMVWEMNQGKLLAIQTEFASPIHAMSFSPDGKFLACAGKTIELFSCDRAAKSPALKVRPRAEAKDGYRWIEEITFSPDDDLIVSVADQWITLWDSKLNKLQSIRAPHVGHNGRAHVLFAQNGRQMLTRQIGRDFDESILWNVGQQTFKPAVDQEKIADMQSEIRLTDFSGRGREVLENRVSGNESVADRVFYRLNPALEALLKTKNLKQLKIPESTYGPGRIAFHPTRPIMATASSGLLHLVDVSKGAVISAHRHQAGVSSLAFSRDGSWLAVGTSGGEVSIWPLTKHQQSLFQTPYAVKFSTNDGHNRANSVRFSADGRTLATATSRGGVAFWEISAADERSKAN